ncbi:MAG: hypothetical protein WBV96_14785, partial [Polyangia bacterium]
MPAPSAQNRARSAGSAPSPSRLPDGGTVSGAGFLNLDDDDNGLAPRPALALLALGNQGKPTARTRVGRG